MLVGKMNHPSKDPLKEIALTSEQRFDFIDLTLEGPAAYRDKLSADKIRKALGHHHLDVVGHTAYYLPIDSCIDRIQEATIRELVADLEFFHDVNASKVTIHFSMSNPMKFITYIEETLYWYKALQKLVPEAEKLGIQLLIEHFRCNDLSLSILENLFAQFSQIGFHLDVGHANLSVPENMTPELLRKFGNRLAHVHISDNFGVDDLHLPLYCGNIDWNMIVKNLKTSGYNDTITLEIFSENDEYLLLSKKYLKKLWEEEI